MAKNIEEIREALASYGITGVKEIYYNPSYEQLFRMKWIQLWKATTKAC